MTNNAWISIEAQELGAAGAHLHDTAVTLRESSVRVRNGCCTPGLGRHGIALTAEAEVVVTRLSGVFEAYVRGAVDVLQRAVAVAQQDQLVTAVGASSAGVTAVGASSAGVTAVGTSSVGSAPTAAADRPVGVLSPESAALPSMFELAAAIGRRFSTPEHRAENIALNNAFMVKRALARADASAGIGNPFFGYSPSGLRTFEEVYGFSFTPKSSAYHGINPPH